VDEQTMTGTTLTEVAMAARNVGLIIISISIIIRAARAGRR
jgi:hypothetical protein